MTSSWFSLISLRKEGLVVPRSFWLHDAALARDYPHPVEGNRPPGLNTVIEMWSNQWFVEGKYGVLTFVKVGSSYYSYRSGQCLPSIHNNKNLPREAWGEMSDISSQTFYFASFSSRVISTVSKLNSLKPLGAAISLLWLILTYMPNYM